MFETSLIVPCSSFTCSKNYILIMMSVFTESFLERHSNSKYLFTEDNGAKGPTRLKAKYSKILREEVWRKLGLIDLAPEASPINLHG